MSYIHENEIFIDKDELIRIEYNKYFIEISEGNFIDLKKVYLENKELQRLQEENRILHEYISDSIPKQVIRDEIEKIKKCKILLPIGYIKKQKTRVLQELLNKEE